MMNIQGSVSIVLVLLLSSSISHEILALHFLPMLMNRRENRLLKEINELEIPIQSGGGSRGTQNEGSISNKVGHLIKLDTLPDIVIDRSYALDKQKMPMSYRESGRPTSQDSFRTETTSNPGGLGLSNCDLKNSIAVGTSGYRISCRGRTNDVSKLDQILNAEYLRISSHFDKMVDQLRNEARAMYARQMNEAYGHKFDSSDK